MSLIETRSLFKRFPDGTVGLDRVSITLPKGSFTVLAGSNGSGKTLLARHLNGLYTPTSGQVFYKGRPIKDQLREVRRCVGLVFQDSDAQFVGHTVVQDIAFGPENLRLSREEVAKRVLQALDEVGLSSLRERHPHTLSGGEKRRLALAGVLAMDPELIVLDEPFIGLDYPGVKAILTLLTHLHKKGCTLLVISHDLAKLLAHAERLIIMKAGTIARDDLPERALAEADHLGVKIPEGALSRMSWLL